MHPNTVSANGKQHRSNDQQIQQLDPQQAARVSPRSPDDQQVRQPEPQQAAGVILGPTNGQQARQPRHQQAAGVSSGSTNGQQVQQSQHQQADGVTSGPTNGQQTQQHQQAARVLPRSTNGQQAPQPQQVPSGFPRSTNGQQVQQPQTPQVARTDGEDNIEDGIEDDEAASEEDDIDTTASQLHIIIHRLKQSTPGKQRDSTPGPSKAVAGPSLRRTRTLQPHGTRLTARTTMMEAWNEPDTINGHYVGLLRRIVHIDNRVSPASDTSSMQTQHTADPRAFEIAVLKTFCQINTEVMEALIRGDLPRVWADDRDGSLKRSVRKHGDSTSEMDKLPCVYVHYIVDENHLGLQCDHIEQLCADLDKLTVDNEGNKFLAAIAAKIANKKPEEFNEDLDAFLESDYDPSNRHTTASHAKEMRTLAMVLRALIAGLPDDSTSRLPISAVGSSIEGLQDRLGQHGHIGSSNFLFIIVRLLLHFKIPGVYHVETFVTAYPNDLWNFHVAEIWLTILTCSYTNTGGCNTEEAGQQCTNDAGDFFWRNNILKLAEHGILERFEKNIKAYLAVRQAHVDAYQKRDPKTMSRDADKAQLQRTQRLVEESRADLIEAVEEVEEKLAEGARLNEEIHRNDERIRAFHENLRANGWLPGGKYFMIKERILRGLEAPNKVQRSGHSTRKIADTQDAD